MEHTANIGLGRNNTLWYGAYLNKSELSKGVQKFLNPAIFAEVIAILEQARSTRMDISIRMRTWKHYVQRSSHVKIAVS